MRFKLLRKITAFAAGALMTAGIVIPTLNTPVKAADEIDMNGTLQVFDTSKFTVDGETLDSYVIDLTGDYDTDDEGDKNAIWDGYFHESELRAAPSFDIRIDGITELN